MHDITPTPGESSAEPAIQQVQPAPPEESAAEEPHEEELFLVGAGLDLTDPNSPLAKYYLRISHIVLIGFLAAFFAAFTHLPLWHTDVWAHLRFGQAIVRQVVDGHGLPKHEPFAESPADKEAQYIHYQWVAQAGAYLIYETGAALAPADADHRLGGGALLLATIHALLLVLRFLLLYKAFVRLCDSPPIALLGVVAVCAMGMLVHLFIIRPQVLGEVAFAAVLLALSAPVVSRRALVWVPLVFLAWANCHGSFAMGFALLGAAVVGRAIEVVMAAPRQAIRALVSDLQFRRLAALVVLSVLATMVNPHGPALLYHSAALSQNPNIPSMEEWKPLPYHNVVHLVFVVSVVALAVLLRLSPRRLTPLQVLLLAGFGLQSVAHARMVVWWIMVFAWVAVPHLRAALDRLPGRIPWLDDTSVPSLRNTVLAGFLAVALLLWARPAWWLVYDEAPSSAGRVMPVTPTKVLACVRDADPTRMVGGALSVRTPLAAVCVADAAETLRGEDWQNRPRVVFCSETLGDYLLWDLGQGWDGPPVRLSCYTHVHLFSPEVWGKCVVVKEAKRDWQKTLDDMGAEFIVVEDDWYEQSRHKAEGKPPGFSNLIDRVRASDRWQVISAPGQPVFMAQRVR
jgi:hypothetical protein